MAEESVPQARLTHIPQGVADYFWQEGRERRAIEADLLELFRRWGYGDVIPPTFEFADVLNARANKQLQAEMYRFLDRDGSTLALRPDMTIAVARLVSTRLHDWPMPQRFCYAGSVFRYTEEQAARQREFRQAGIELIGAAGPEADAEVLTLTARAIQACALPSYRLVIGQMGFFHGLLEDLALRPDARRMLLDAVDRNSEPELAEFLRTTPLRTQQRRTTEELLALSGADANTIIDRADRLCLNYPMHKALENLRAIYALMDAQSLAQHIYIDLTEISNLGYYTGMTFEALTPELGFPIASGGRYDNLVGTFGPVHPAVGAAIEIDRIMLARSGGTNKRAQRRPVPPHLLIDAGGSALCYAIIDEWRRQGLHIASEVLGRSGPALYAAAEAVGAQAALTWADDSFLLYENRQPEPRRLLADEWDAFATRVLSQAVTSPSPGASETTAS